MATLYWDPIQGLDLVRREMERVFDQADPVRRVVNRLTGQSAIGGRVFPLLNVSENKDSILVEALAPGLDPDSIEVSVLRDQLRISGVKSAVNPDIKPEAYHRSERGAGHFMRAISLPVEVDGDKVAAEYKNGLLLLTLPKHEAAKPKKITVNVQ